MRRRDILALLASLTTAPQTWAQTSGRLPVVGFLGFASKEADRELLGAFREGLKEQGHVEGQTILAESRYAGGDLKLAAQYIDELVRRPVDIFVAPGLAATRSIHSTTQIPIVALGLPPAVGDHGLFASLAKPGGTVTGLFHFGEELSAKRIEVLREILPKTSVLGILHNLTDPVFRDWDVQTEAYTRAQALAPLRLGLRSSSPGEVAELLRSLRNQGGDAVLVIHDFLTQTVKDHIIRNSAELGIAVIAAQRAFVEAGALMAYGADDLDLFRCGAVYVDRIVKGEKAGNLPIQLPTKFEFIVNLKAAKTLGVEIPLTLLARADEVIE